MLVVDIVIQEFLAISQERLFLLQHFERGLLIYTDREEHLRHVAGPIWNLISERDEVIILANNDEENSNQTDQYCQDEY